DRYDFEMPARSASSDNVMPLCVRKWLMFVPIMARPLLFRGGALRLLIPLILPSFILLSAAQTEFSDVSAHAIVTPRLGMVLQPPPYAVYVPATARPGFMAVFSLSMTRSCSSAVMDEPDGRQIPVRN